MGWGGSGQRAGKKKKKKQVPGLVSFPCSLVSCAGCLTHLGILIDLDLLLGARRGAGHVNLRHHGEKERGKARSLAQELRQSKPDDWGDGRRAGRRPSRAVTVPHRSSTPAILLVVVDDPHLHVVVRSSVWVGCARRVALLLWLLDPLDLWAPPPFLFFLFFPSCVEIRSCGIPLADPAAEAAAEVTSRRKWEFLDFSITTKMIFNVPRSTPFGRPPWLPDGPLA